MDKEIEFQAVTQSLQFLYGDEKAAEYIRWIIKSDTAREYWLQNK